MKTSATGMPLRHLRDLFRSGTVIGHTDGQLLARYATFNDGSAFEALVMRHEPMVVATCRAVLKHEHDIEDAFQSTFLVLARKAGSVRAGNALGGWLHRVAYRSAVQVKIEAKRRRQHESEVAAMGISDATRPGLELDLCSILHEEIERLPERERLPVVLVDLEGLTYEQAAGHLHWTVPALCYRLAKARERLRDRLTRRGMTAKSLGVVMALSRTTATASLPASWTLTAVALATGGPTPAAVAALTQTIIRGMLMTQLKIASAAILAAAGFVLIGVVALGEARPDSPRPAPRATVVADERPVAAKTPPAAKDVTLTKPAPGAMIEMRGRVVDPDGKPVAGATVRTAYVGVNRDIMAASGTISGSDGRFLMRVPSPRRVLDSVRARGMLPWIIAAAPGFGPGSNSAFPKPGTSSDLTIRLVEDDPPIEGRIVDLEGRPVAGARVNVDRLWYAREGKLSDWLAQAQDRGVQGPWQGLGLLPMAKEFTIAATTGPDGRFRLAGTGRDRIAEILVSGPTIATAHLYVLNRDGPAIPIVKQRSMRPMTPERTTYYARRFDYAAAPTRPIEGTIRDKDTGRPLAGIKLQGMVFEEHSYLWAPGVEAATDAQGRYRLAGLARGPAYRLSVEPGEGQPYLGAVLRAPADSPGLEPVRFDIALKRGILVRGRVTDKATGKPVSSGYVESHVFSDNPHVREFPGYGQREPPSAFLQDDGRYEVVTLPGRGIIACLSDAGRYRGGTGAAAIRGYDPSLAGVGGFPTLHLCAIVDYHVLAEVDIDPQAEPATVDLQVDPGRTLTVTAVDPEGKPIGGTKARGLTDLGGFDYEQESPSFEVHSLDPSKPRRVRITHAGRKLAGSVDLKGNETS
ncbi:MAG TPA: sigma-70 family RNA polymerase sigma factor, partial [Isosphaeraceae bacterium]|nr:sigma-70 family RNA polymerase sigma factor [Isosphaeraceae bacterium]